MSYSSEIYNAAEQKMEQRRTKAEAELAFRRRILYARSSRAEEIEHQIARTSVEVARAVLGGADIRPKLETLREQNLALQRELEEIITGFGLEKNYLELWYQCPLCKDKGDIDGKMCDCMKKMLRQISYDRLNKSSPLSLSDFDSFSLGYYEKVSLEPGEPIPYTHMMGVLGFCKKYARTFATETSKSLLFQGAPGLGKTHLSLAIANELIQKGFGVIYVSAPTLFSKIARDNFDFDNKSLDDLSAEQLLVDCDLLILDDLGAEFVSRITIATLYNLLNSRMILSKPTIVSTNLSLSELQKMYNPRIISRIIGNLRRVEFIGTDIRQQKKRNKKIKSNEI